MRGAKHRLQAKHGAVRQEYAFAVTTVQYGHLLYKLLCTHYQQRLMCQRAAVTDNMICTWTAATGVQILLYKLPCTTPLYRQCMSQTEYDQKQQYKNVSSCRQLTACRSLAKSLWQMWCARFAVVTETHDKHLYVYMENLRKYTKHSTCEQRRGR